MNLATFSALAGVFGLMGYRTRILQRPDFRRLASAVYFALTAAFASMAIITAIGYIPDDWSANRLTWSGGLFYGYPLYPGENGPSNGFFYPPAGAWFYLPASGLGILLRSPIAGLAMGWCMSLACLLTPIILLLHLLNRHHRNRHSEGLLALATAVCIIFSCPPLRYVATMVHVDAPALLFLGISLVLVLTVSPSGMRRFQFSGACLVLSAFSKQSVWPLLPLIIAVVIMFHGRPAIFHLLISAMLCFLFLMVVTLASENGLEAFRMIWKLPSHQITITSVSSALRQFFICGLPVCGLIGILLLTKYLCSSRIDYEIRQSSLLFFILALLMIPFAIFTRLRIGADSNHLAIPFYLALLGCMTILPSRLTNLLQAPSLIPSSIFSSGIALLLAASLTPYLSQCCGWYLWSHNPHKEALKYEFSQRKRTYFPWQIYSMLIAEGKLYHMDDCLRYEVSAGWKRSEASLRKYFPEEPFQIAIRPFGAPSYTVQEENYKRMASEPSLKNWEIYRKSP